MTSGNLINVFTPETEWQGDLIVQELKDHQIDAYLANRTTSNILSGMLPKIPMEILVPEENAEKAQKIIEDFFNQHIQCSDAEMDYLPDDEEPE
jgi:hypothetical protein